MIINQDFKNLFKIYIDDVISSTGLTNLCTLRFNNGSADFCDNCEFDMISKVSANKYNGTGPIYFPENTICPVCGGLGVKSNNNISKDIYLAVILDSKYFMNIDKTVLNIPQGTIQTICKTIHIVDLMNANSMIIKNNPSVSYERIEQPNLSGLGDLDYIITTWRRQ